ncbi:MAG: DUF937 domain-containing protein [Methylobacteriaceae bacterium]|nr:DUF937 domain-containing protein [Methylobacteriaceae bacterium]
MVHLLDIVREAQKGLLLDNWSRQFGLSPTDTQRAVEALLPAFSLGLRNVARDPGAFARMLELMASGRYTPFFDGGGASVSANPQEALFELFRSPEVSRQVAAQVSAATGIGVQVLQQMMPALAGVLMGGLFRYASLEGMSDLLRQWSDWLRAASPSAPRQRSPGEATARFYDAWQDMVTAFFAPGAARPAAAPPPPEDVWTAMARAMTAGAAPPAPPPPPPPSVFAPLAAMFETGREVQTQHLANLQALFDELWTPRPR